MSMFSMRGPNPFVVASLRLVSILYDMLKKPEEAKDPRSQAHLGQQAWETLGCLGSQHLEESNAGLFSPWDQVVEGVIPIATGYDPHGEHGALRYIVSAASTYAQAKEEEGDDIYVDEYLGQAETTIEFLLHVSLGARWVGSMSANLDEADWGYMAETKVAMEENGEAAQIALLLKQAEEYEQWAVAQLEAGGEVAEYLVAQAGNGNWLSNQLAFLGLARTKEVEVMFAGQRYTRQAIDLNLQERENCPDWLLKLLTLAKILE